MSYINQKEEDRVPNGFNEHLEYASFHEVLQEVRDVLILDLAQFTNQIPINYAAWLQPEPAGVYVYGSLNPIATFDGRDPLFSKTAFQKDPKVPDICSFEDFIQCSEPIANGAGKIIATNPKQNHRFYKRNCTYDRSAIFIAAIHVWDILSHLHRDTEPYTNIGLQQLTIENYLLPDAPKEIITTDMHPGIQRLTKQVLDFISRDVHCVYSLRMRNSVIHVEKGLDYRVIEYYRARFEELDSQIESHYGF